MKSERVLQRVDAEWEALRESYAGLSDVELLEPGTVYAEGAPATCFYVLLEGTVVLSRRVGADDIEVGRTSEKREVLEPWKPEPDQRALEWE